MSREVSSGVQHVALANVLSLVTGHEICQHNICGFSGFKPGETFGAPEWIHEGLCRNSGAGTDVGHKSAAGEKPRGNGDTDFPTVGVTGDE